MNAITVIGYVIDEPKHVVFEDGRQRLCFRVASIRYGRGRKAETKFSVNYGWLDERIQQGRQIMVFGTLKPNYKGHAVYLNIDANHVVVGNVPITTPPKRLTQYWERPSADEDDPDKVVAYDPGYDDGKKKRTRRKTNSSAPEGDRPAED